jgi:uncharacterized protein involved in outer membrane biogenesis
MRRIARIIAGTSIAVALAAVLLPLTIDLDKVRQRSADRLGRALGRPVVFTQPLALHLLPIPILTTGPVMVGNVEAPIAEVGGVTARLRISALLAGRIEPQELTLERPTAHLPGAHVGLDRITLVRPANRTSITGQARWKGRVATLSVSLPDDDGAGPLAFSLRQPEFQAELAFSGSSAPLPQGRLIKGRLTAQAGDLGPFGGPAGQAFSLDASIEAGGGELTVSGLTASAGPTRVAADLTAAHGDPAMVDLTATVQGLNLDDWLARPEAVEQAQAAQSPDQPVAPRGDHTQAQAPSLPESWRLPKGLFANVEITLDALSWKGQTIPAASLSAALEDGALVIRQAELKTGRAEARIEGILTTPDPGPAFDGKLAIASGDMTAQGDVVLAWPDLMVADALVRKDGRQARGALTVTAALPVPVHLKAQLDGQPPFEVSGNVSWTGSAADIDDVRLAWNGAQADGRLRAMQGAERWKLEGTLAAGPLDLDRMLRHSPAAAKTAQAPAKPPRAANGKQPAAPRATPSAAPQASPFATQPFDLAFLSAADAALAVSAQSVTIGGLRVYGLRARVAVDDGTARIDTLTGTLWDGTVTGWVRLNSVPAPSLALSAALDGADIGKAGLSFAGLTLTGGRAQAATDLKARGASPADMAQTLTGTGTLTVTDGLVSGIDLPAISRQLSHVESLGNVAALLQGGLGGGTTPVRKLAGTFTARNGIIDTRDLRLDAEGGRADMTGTLDLPRWRTSTQLSLRLGDGSAPPLLVRLDGPVSNPSKVVDLNAIQRYLVEQGLGKALRKNQDGNGGKVNGAKVLRELFKGLGGR